MSGIGGAGNAAYFAYPHTADEYEFKVRSAEVQQAMVRIEAKYGPDVRGAKALILKEQLEADPAYLASREDPKIKAEFDAVRILARYSRSN